MITVCRKKLVAKISLSYIWIFPHIGEVFMEQALTSCNFNTNTWIAVRLYPITLVSNCSTVCAYLI